MTFTLLWFPTAHESIFLSDRIAGTDVLSSRPVLNASSFEKVEKQSKLFARGSLVGLISLFWLDWLLKQWWQAQHLRRFAVRTTHFFRLAGFPSLPQTVNILLFFVLWMTCEELFSLLLRQWSEEVPFSMFQEGSRDANSDTDLWISFPGYCYALTKFAEEGDGRFGAGYQCRLLLRTQVVVIWAEIHKKNGRLRAWKSTLKNSICEKVKKTRLQKKQPYCITHSHLQVALCP